MSDMMPCPNRGDNAHRVYRDGDGYGRAYRGAYFCGHLEDGRKVYLCCDCGCTFDEKGTRVKANATLIDEDDLCPKSLKSRW